MKKNYLLFLFTLFAVTLYSQDNTQSLVIEKIDNSNEYIAFDAVQRITFNSSNVNIEKKDGTIVTNDMADIYRIKNTYSTNIHNSFAEKDNFLQYISPDEIAINCPAGSTIKIYSISGSLIASTHQDADNGTISIASLPKGIYLIRANERTPKFIRR